MRGKVRVLVMGAVGFGFWGRLSCFCFLKRGVVRLEREREEGDTVILPYTPMYGAI